MVVSTDALGGANNLFTLLASGFSGKPDAVAIETTTQRYTWRDIDAATGRLANLLGSLHLPAGARVAAYTEKSPQALMLYLATLRAGLVYLPLNTAYRESELDYFLGDAEPAVVVYGSADMAWMAPLLERRIAAAGTVHGFTLDANGEGTLMSAAAHFPDACATVVRHADELAAILYTSGTTGRSKGAMLSHGNLAANALTLRDYWGWRGDDVLLHMLPIFHVHGLFVAAQGALLAGARMLWRTKFDVDEALAALPHATVMMGVPTYYVRLLADSRFDRSVCPKVRLFVSGSAPLLTETFESFADRMGQPILERYGMSETNMLTSNPYRREDGARIGGTVGRALPGVSVRVVDDVNQALPVGEIGNVQVRGPNVFSGYWRMPEKTREEFAPEGWFKTGDVGRFGGAPGVPDDYLSIVGRSKDLIITGGFNVYPKEIETVLDDLPGVAESAVIGVPHPDFGEAVVAVVVAKAGVLLDPAAIQAALKAGIANFKVPKRIHVVDQLPRNTMGKVQKNVLRERYAAL